MRKVLVFNSYCLREMTSCVQFLLFHFEPCLALCAPHIHVQDNLSFLSFSIGLYMCCFFITLNKVFVHLCHILVVDIYKYIYIYILRNKIKATENRAIGSCYLNTYNRTIRYDKWQNNLKIQEKKEFFRQIFSAIFGKSVAVQYISTYLNNTRLSRDFLLLLSCYGVCISSIYVKTFYIFY